MKKSAVIDAFDTWWNTKPEPHISAPRHCHVGMQQERMMAIWMVAFEAGRQQGIRQERALWELSAMTQEFDNTHPAKTLTDEEITDIAHTLLIATDAIEYEWGICVTQFARAILRKAQEK